MTVWTIGHSTRSAEEFREAIGSYDIELVVDVRRFAGSRRNPQFSPDALERDLAAVGVSYWPIPALGGRRRAAADSVNTAWRHPAFRGYADYIATEDFAEGLFELLLLAHGLRTVIMCAELLWWRCHRRLIADVLVSIGMEVVDIRDAKVAEPHRLVAPARLVRGRLSYAREPSPSR